MGRFGLSGSGWRSRLLARGLTALFTAVLLVAAVDLHSLRHQRDRAGDDSHGDHHPEPAHLDGGAVDLPCPACLFGLKSQSRPAEAPGAIGRPQERDRLVPAAGGGIFAELDFRLPLSRAPPLS